MSDSLPARWQRWRTWALTGAVIAAIGSGAVLYPRVERGPYLQESSPHSVIVRWRTNWAIKSVVHYGLAPDQLTQTAAASDQTRDHALSLAGLLPGTRYFYAVEAVPRVGLGRRVHSFITPGEAGSAGPVRVWVIGDPGTGQRDQRAVRDAFYQFSAAHPADLWLTLGDNAYRKGSDADYQSGFFDCYSALLATTALWPTLGNHDARSCNSDAESGVYFDIFSLPTRGQCGGVMSGTEAYYSFDYANVHFVCLDSADSDRSAGGPMLSWLERDLSASHLDWTIAYWHHPPYSKGSHDSDNDQDSGGRMREMREHALPILEAYGVDLVLCGHSHNYERSWLLDGHYGPSSSLADGMIRDHGDGREDGSGAYHKERHASHQGTVYVVAGSSGHAGNLQPTPHPAMCVATNVPGSLILDLDALRLDATFLDGAGVVRDRFTILKQERQTRTAVRLNRSTDTSPVQ